MSYYCNILVGQIVSTKEAGFGSAWELAMNGEIRLCTADFWH